MTQCMCYLTVDVFGCLGEQMMDYVMMSQFSCQMQTGETHDILRLQHDSH